MEQRTFNLLDIVCREGLGNDVWGVVDGGDTDTKHLFGTKDSRELEGMFLYVYMNKEEHYPCLDRFDADLTVNSEDGDEIRLYELF